MHAFVVCSQLISTPEALFKVEAMSNVASRAKRMFRDHFRVSPIEGVTWQQYWQAIGMPGRAIWTTQARKMNEREAQGDQGGKDIQSQQREAREVQSLPIFRAFQAGAASQSLLPESQEPPDAEEEEPTNPAARAPHGRT